MSAGKKMTPKERAIKHAHEVLRRAQKRGRLPSLSGKTQQEREDAKWIEEMREAKLLYEVKRRRR